MAVNSQKWFLPLLLVVFALLLVYFIVDYSSHLSEDVSCPGQGAGQGQGRLFSQTFTLLIIILLVIFLLIPIIYILLSRNVKNQLEKNLRLIAEIVNCDESKSKKKDDEASSKILFLKFLSYGENKVIKKLIENKGTVLQSELSRMETMGKVRTHRILIELKKKGIVTLEKYGKTNRVTLSDEAKQVLLK